MREPGMAERLSALTPEQRALLELLRKKKAKTAGHRVHLPPPIPRVSGPTGEGDWPLAFDQEWLLEVVEAAPESNAYNVDATTRLLGRFDFPALAAAYNEIVRRHAAWRTTFPRVDGRPVQRVSPHREQPLLIVDLTAAPAERRERLAQLALLQATQEPFDLEHGPLLRLVFARLGPEEHACLITVHHLVTDWIAFHIFWSELSALYAAALTGRPSPLAELPVQYVDYAVWLRQWLQGEALEELAGYWRNRLSGFPLALELPTDRPRQAQRRMKGGRYIIETGPEPAERLRSLAQREGATMFMATFAVVYALLHRFTGQEKIVLGSNNANRNRPEIEPVIGYFLIPVAFAVDLSGDPTLRELVGRVRATALEAFLYQDMPFAKLLEAVQPEPRPGMPPIFQSLVLVLDGQFNQSRIEGINGAPFHLYDAGARYDMMFGFYDTPAGIFGPVEYDYSLFDLSSIARLMGLFYRLLEAFGSDPDLRLSQLPTLDSVERRQVLANLLEGEVAPETERRASRLSDILRRRGVGPGDHVGLLVEPAPDAAALALATTRLNAVPVPLEPGEPAFRLNPLLVDPDMVLLVHGGALAGDLRPTCPCVALVDLMEEAA